MLAQYVGSVFAMIATLCVGGFFVRRAQQAAWSSDVSLSNYVANSAVIAVAMTTPGGIIMLTVALLNVRPKHPLAFILVLLLAVVFNAILMGTVGAIAGGVFYGLRRLIGGDVRRLDKVHPLDDLSS